MSQGSSHLIQVCCPTLGRASRMRQESPFFPLLHTEQPKQPWPLGSLLPPSSPSAAVPPPSPPRFHRRKASVGAPESPRSSVVVETTARRSSSPETRNQSSTGRLQGRGKGRTP